MSQPTIARFFKSKKDDKVPVSKTEEKEEPQMASGSGEKRNESDAPIDFTGCEQT